MYEAHFQLVNAPFRESIDPAEWVGLPSREAALRRLAFAIERTRGPALIFGPAGAGKSMIARKYAESRNGPVVEIPFPELSARDLLSYMARELNCVSPAETGLETADLARTLHSRIADFARAETRVLVWIDHVQTLHEPDAFEALNALSGFRSDGSPALDVVYCGTTEAVLNAPRAFLDRLAARCLAGPLSESETETYVTDRLKLAGASRCLFDPPALRLLHQAGGGLPRSLNRISDLALLIAATQGRPRVNERIVALAATEYQSPLP